MGLGDRQADITPEQAFAAARHRCYKVWGLIGIVIVAVGVLWLLRELAMPVGVIIWSAVITFILSGMVDKLEKKGVNRLAGTTVAFLTLVVVLAVLLLLMFSPMFGFGEQFSSLLEGIPVYMQALMDWGADIYSRYEFLFKNDSVNEWIAMAAKAVGDTASSVASGAAEGVVSVGSVMVSSVVTIGFAVVVSFWLLMELPALGREFMRLVSPKYHDDVHMLHFTATRIMGGYIKGTLLQCLIIGVGCGILFAVCGLDNAAALGVIAGVFNILPIIGPWIGGAIAAIVALMISPWIALIVVVGTVIIQQVVYTFIGPRIMQNNVDIHPALTLIVLLAGSAIGGLFGGLVGSLVGMLLGIPAVAVFKAMFVFYFERRTGRHLLAPDGVFFQGEPKWVDDPWEMPVPESEEACAPSGADAPGEEEPPNNQESPCDADTVAKK